MSSTKSTTQYNLPIFVDDDKPTWRGDFNDAMQKIEDAFNAQQARINELQSQIVTLQNKVG